MGSIYSMMSVPATHISGTGTLAELSSENPISTFKVHEPTTPYVATKSLSRGSLSRWVFEILQMKFSCVRGGG